MADTSDLKSDGNNSHAGSSPAPGTIVYTIDISNFIIFCRHCKNEIKYNEMTSGCPRCGAFEKWSMDLNKLYHATHSLYLHERNYWRCRACGMAGKEALEAPCTKVKIPAGGKVELHPSHQIKYIKEFGYFECSKCGVTDDGATWGKLTEPCKMDEMPDGDKLVEAASLFQVPDTPDMVNHPPHYQTGSGIEVIDVLEAFDLPRNLANAVKYILRAGKKNDEKEDLEKSIWYLRRHITEANTEITFEIRRRLKARKPEQEPVSEGSFAEERAEAGQEYKASVLGGDANRELATKFPDDEDRTL